jgi:enamine deaminase RidA (YjgF/YER057c/UK114 family)
MAIGRTAIITGASRGIGASFDQGGVARGRRCARVQLVADKGSERGGVERRLRDLGIELPGPPSPFGSYVETLQTGNLLFLSGMLPVVDHKPKYVGRLGKELDAESGRDAARTAALSALAAAQKHLGSLDRVTRVVRLGVFIATSGISSTSLMSPTLRRICFETSSAVRRWPCDRWLAWPAFPSGCRSSSRSSLRLRSAAKRRLTSAL